MSLLNRLSTKKQQEQVVEQKHQSQKQPLSNFEKTLKQLNAPYKKSKGYELFGKQNKSETSVFWDTNMGYVQKYENERC